MASVVASLASLLKRSQIDDHGEVLASAEHALKQSKSDLEAQQVKVVALLNLDRFEEAGKAFETGGQKLQDKAPLEYAYTLYKTGKAKQAAEFAAKGEGRGYEHVEAQARYRTEDFRRAAELYKSLAGDLEDDAEADLRINVGAVNAQLEWAGQGELVKHKKPGREDLEAFETAYNAACGSIARGELGQGEVLLRRAVDLCNALDDLSEEEKEAELLPIRVQQIYVLTRQGREEEAQKLSETVDAKSIPDKSTRHIAQVNRVAASSTTANSFLIERLVSSDIEKLKPDYPFHYQASILNENKHATALQTLKFGGTVDSTSSVIAQEPAPTLNSHINYLSAINAAAHAKNAVGKDALKHILPLIQQRPHDVGLVLAIVQLYFVTGNATSAINLLENFFTSIEASSADVRFGPGLVGVAVSLYHSLGRRTDIRTEFSKAASHWRRKSKDRPQGVIHLLKAAGASLLESTDAEHQTLAKEIFTELHDLDPSDRFSAAGLLAASPETSSSQDSSALTPIPRLISTIDVDALENAGIAQPPNAPDTITSRKRPAEDTKPKKAKKIRKSKMPKDYDPAKKVDPERWLPMRDRSYYRPKGKKGKAKQALLSQGAAPALESEGSRPATPGGEVVKGKQQQGGGGGKNKKKGKKW